MNKRNSFQKTIDRGSLYNWNADPIAGGVVFRRPGRVAGAAELSPEIRWHHISPRRAAPLRQQTKTNSAQKNPSSYILDCIRKQRRDSDRGFLFEIAAEHRCPGFSVAFGLFHRTGALRRELSALA